MRQMVLPPPRGAAVQIRCTECDWVFYTQTLCARELLSKNGAFRCPSRPVNCSNPFIRHAVPTGAIAQFQTDRQLRLRKSLPSFAATMLNLLHCRSSLPLLFSSTPIIWERTASRWEIDLLIPPVNDFYPVVLGKLVYVLLLPDYASEQPNL